MVRRLQGKRDAGLWREGRGLEPEAISRVPYEMVVYGTEMWGSRKSKSETEVLTAFRPRILVVCWGIGVVDEDDFNGRFGGLEA